MTEVQQFAGASELARLFDQFAASGEVWIRRQVQPLVSLLKSVQLPHDDLARLMYEDYRAHRIRCRLCNPAGNPKPLRVNGAEYQRRTRARRRRNRR